MQSIFLYVANVSASSGCVKCDVLGGRLHMNVRSPGATSRQRFRHARGQAQALALLLQETLSASEHGSASLLLSAARRRSHGDARLRGHRREERHRQRHAPRRKHQACRTQNGLREQAHAGEPEAFIFFCFFFSADVTAKPCKLLRYRSNNLRTLSGDTPCFAPTHSYVGHITNDILALLIRFDSGVYTYTRFFATGLLRKNVH
jgi:hypothetical protein